jgi:pentose-5-phosphate-3-epimerase
VVDVPAHGTGRADPQLSVGILTADLTRLGEEVSILHGSGCWAHVDVMVVAVEPGWPGHGPAVSTRRRVEAVRELADRLGCTPRVGVDGGVSLANAAQIASWGVDVIVSGRAIYDGTDPAGNLHRMLEQIRSVPAGGRLAAAAS